jgi:hypothetical protein
VGRYPIVKLDAAALAAARTEIEMPCRHGFRHWPARDGEATLQEA